MENSSVKKSQLGYQCVGCEDYYLRIWIIPGCQHCYCEECYEELKTKIKSSKVQCIARGCPFSYGEESLPKDINDLSRYIESKKEPTPEKKVEVEDSCDKNTIEQFRFQAQPENEEPKHWIAKYLLRVCDQIEEDEYFITK
ncbi:unnamed protein product [Moneuplotes crassus]|uniref:RING-type domain-containing protein n=1 Tax=Euplotes crassus TaxID=5936 RepID=A0AAD1Y397_EUPCR|nr:unnamed protein product [Moneuplotes crassus]